MKKILGLDLGSTSIGWAFVHEADTENETTKIIDAGVRVVPLTTDEINNFGNGQTIATNADRRLKRSARRNLQRFKLRRKVLLELLVKNGFISAANEIPENGEKSTFRNWKLRSKAATEKVELNELAIVLMMLNKKRGYKSSRKTKSVEEDGSAVDAVDLSLKLKHQNLTPGQYLFQQLTTASKFVKPDFYASDLNDEIGAILKEQSKYHSEIDNAFQEKFLSPSTKAQCLNFLKKDKKIELCEVPKKRIEKQYFYFQQRSLAVTESIPLETLAFVLTEIKGEVDKVSGYLGAISDRSKILRTNDLTVGQYLFSKLLKDPHNPLKNIIFYRQDYVDEFNKIWETQSKFHTVLTDELQKELRDLVIFYQRRLKSQKHLVAACEFAAQVQIKDPLNSGKSIYLKKKAAPKSSPMFQEFRLLQSLNNLRVKELKTGESFCVDEENYKLLYSWLQLKRSLTDKEIIRILKVNTEDFELNLKEVIGNRTRSAFIDALQKIIVLTGHDEIDISMKRNPQEIESDLRSFCGGLGINETLLDFDAYSYDFEKQLYYRVWHLLYSAEEDEHIKEELLDWLKIDHTMLRAFYAIPLEDDFSSVSTWAIRRLLPHLKSGLDIDSACSKYSEKNPKKAFQHSVYLTKEENENRELKPKLDLIKQGELRNPVVEKITNQLINMVNAIIEDSSLGRPDEIRIEMARELKASNDERNSLSKAISKNQKRNQEIKDLLLREFGVALKGRVTPNDILRYKLWIECNKISVYTGNRIQGSDLFNGEYDIEHIIPKSKFFDDSFTNKTLCERKINEEKGNDTAYTYFEKKGTEQLEQFLKRVDYLFKLGFSSNGEHGISRRKKEILLTPNDKIPDDFITRQLQETRFITRKASEILHEITRKITFTTGSVTKKLREDWGLVDVLKELNWDKYSQIEGRTEIIEGRNGERLKRIKDWDKRNDHRHHAMDAITVALTKPAFIQLFNNMNAENKKHYALLSNHTQNGKVIKPFENIRTEARLKLGAIFISHKAKNKVTTPNINYIQTRYGRVKVTQSQDVPRGQLHKETVYGSSKFYNTRFIKITANTTLEEVHQISNQRYKEVILKRLGEFNGDMSVAFGGKNALSKKPIFLDDDQKYQLPDKIKITELQDRFTIRKAIGPDLKIDKVVDPKIREILAQRKNELGDKNAFVNLDENPIWLNEEAGIRVKSVAISGVNNATPLHFKRNHLGEYLLDENGMRIPNDFVSLGNNHHVAIFRDLEGNLQEEVVSFYEAVSRKKRGEEVIQKAHPKGWEFVFTLKQNDMFVIPSESFNPAEIDPNDPDSYPIISQRLFRVQKLTSKDYWFRHHLETTVTNDIKNITFIHVQSLQRLEGLVKCRINHLGKITQWNICD